MVIKKKCIVIGYGSIGRRHTRILNEIGHDVAVVSRREVDFSSRYSSIEKAIKEENPDYIVVANETNRHKETIDQIIATGYQQKVLIEKPLYAVMEQQQEIDNLYVGYNLRFHPLLQMLAGKIGSSKIISVQCYVGQYLPSWRPDVDYTKVYSANKEAGGGVLRDLSHELDYLQFLFGEWQAMTASGGKYSNLNIDSEDHFSILYQTEKVPIISVQMNYLDHIGQRLLIVNTNTETYKVDFIKNTLQINNEIINVEIERDETYRLQHLAVLQNEDKYLCTCKEGRKIVNMIEKAELAAEKKVWVSNE